MKIAVIMQCHKNPEQINRLIDALSHPEIDIIVHVDKKSSITSGIDTNGKAVTFVPDEKRIDVKWGTFSQVEATLSLLDVAMGQNNYDYYCLISGQDFPTVSANELVSSLRDNSPTNYVNFFTSKNHGAGKSTNYDKRNEIVFKEWMFGRGLFYRILRRSWVQITGGYSHTFAIFKRKNVCNLPFYFGSSWWCLTGDTVKYIMSYIKEHSEYIAFFKKSSCSDESFFQTLVMSSPFSNDLSDYLHYVDWSEGKSNPKILTSADLDTVFRSGKPLARKIDTGVDKNIIDEMLIRIKQRDEEKHD